VSRFIADHLARIVVGVLIGVLVFFITNPFDNEGKEDPPPPEVEARGGLPHKVVNTGQLGLIVRSCPDETCGCTGIDCEKLGAAADDTILRVVCQQNTEFVPAGLTEGPWYRIRWTNDNGGTSEIGAGESTVDAPIQGWVFSQYLEPTGDEPLDSCDLG
jgi:hypothetical protein